MLGNDVTLLSTINLWIPRKGPARESGGPPFVTDRSLWVMGTPLGGSKLPEPGKPESKFPPYDQTLNDDPHLPDSGADSKKKRNCDRQVLSS